MTNSPRDILKSQRLKYYSGAALVLFGAYALVQWVIFPSSSEVQTEYYEETLDLPSDSVTPQDAFVHQTKNDQIIMKKQIEFLQEQLKQGEKKSVNHEKEKIELRIELEELKKMLKGISTPKEGSLNQDYIDDPFSSSGAIATQQINPLHCVEIEQEEAPSNLVGEIIPAGTSVKVKLLSGVEAVCSSDSVNDPIPVKLRAIDYAYLPKHLRLNLKGAYFVGSAYGSLSNKRVIIRLERMSLIYESGEQVETEVSAWVTGEDGIYGVKGELYRNTKEIMANAVTSGLLAEAGDITKSALLNATTHKAKNTNSTSLLIGENFGKSTSGRTSNTFDFLSEEYIKEAKEIKPVVKVDSGRTVDVTFSIGVKLGETNTKNKLKKIRENSRLKEASLGR